VGKRLLDHDQTPSDLGGKVRSNNTYKSNIDFTPTLSSSKANFLPKSPMNPNRPPPTRASYMDSDIFGIKNGAPTVQSNAYSTKQIKERTTATFQSHVIGDSMPQNNERNHVARQEKQWESHVFGEAVQEKATRKCLAKQGAGYAGLYGDENDKLWDKRQTFAGQISKKEETRAPKEDNTKADDRKMKELYGNSSYEPLKKDFWKNQSKEEAP
jgi:hypothetical protein